MLQINFSNEFGKLSKDCVNIELFEKSYIFNLFGKLFTNLLKLLCKYNFVKLFGKYPSISIL